MYFPRSQVLLSHPNRSKAMTKKSSIWGKSRHASTDHGGAPREINCEGLQLRELQAKILDRGPVSIPACLVSRVAAVGVPHS